MKKSKKKICLLIFVILFVFVFLFTACKIKDGEKDNNGDNSSGDIVESGDINSGDNPVHKHEFSTEWSCDDKYHWHACKECGEADEKQEHDFDSRNKCKQCGYLKYTEGLTLILIKDVNGGLYYSVRNVGSAADSLIVIPSEINGYPVKEIESNAFKNCTYIEDFIMAKFEDREYKIPKGYDLYLTKHYGDYMQLPPKEKQVSNHDNIAYWRE